VRTPKGLLIVVLAIVVALAGTGEGWALAGPGLVAAVLAAMLIDLPILRFRKRRWVFPDGAMLTGMIVAMVLSPHEPWWIAAITAALAIASKYAVRAGTANVFNPAALALVVTFHLLNSGQSWWGALPEVATAALLLLLAAGLYVTAKVNKLPVVLAFLGCYYLLITIAAFVGEPARVAELYRAPDLHAALFFAFFMVTDPPTSPPRHRDQLVYGAIVAAVGFVAFEWYGGADYLLVGLLVANAWEGWRRTRARIIRTSRAASTA
jgi:Na+-translocating ferredoxin:NAD+ oxidoreductase RnfD subunit